MFKGWTFHLAEGINPFTKEIILKHEGAFTDNKQQATCCLVDADYVVRRNKFEEKNIVLAHWVAACHVREKVIDQRIFRVSQKESDENQKRLHGVLYSTEEDQTLLDFAEQHKEPKLTKEQLWQLAEEEGILERSALSMLQRYRILKQRKNKKFKHYAKYDVHNILAWAYCWYRLIPKDPNGHEKKKIWETAASRYLVDGKTASELEAKFNQLARKYGGVDKAIEEGHDHVAGQTWLEELYIVDDKN